MFETTPPHFVILLFVLIGFAKVMKITLCCCFTHPKGRKSNQYSDLYFDIDVKYFKTPICIFLPPWKKLP